MTKVIPKRIRKNIPSIKPGVKVLVENLGRNSVKVSAKDKGKDVLWVKRNYGFAGNVWRRKDATRYVRKLRNEEWK